MNLIEKLKALRARNDELLASAEGGLLSAEQQQEFDSNCDEMDQITAQIERESRHKSKSDYFEETDANIPRLKPAHVEVIDNRVNDPMRGFESINEFAQCVRVAQVDSVVDDRLKIQSASTNFHRETNSTDGYMVPPQIRQEIWDVVTEDDPANLLNLVDSEPTVSNTVEKPKDESTPWGSAGVQAYWEGEGDAGNESRLATEMSDVKLHKLMAFVTASEELMEDAPRLQNRLTQKAGLAIRWKANEAILFGDGVRKPYGFLASAAKVSVAKETGQSADTIVDGNITKMFSRLLTTGMSRAIFLANSDTFPQLAALQIGDQPVFLPPRGLADAPLGTLMGRPLILTEHAKTLGDQGDIMLVDPKGYYLATKTGGVKFAVSMHLYFNQDLGAYRWTFRLGGQPHLSSAINPAYGSNTKSHFVVLDERA